MATKPFDLYSLSLFKHVAEEASFTRAGNLVGLTQSAVTKQIRKMEEQLGVTLFERTTRTVRLSPAGEYLFERSNKILSSLDDSILQLREDFGDGPKTLRIGISPTIALSYLPGFFVPFRKVSPRTNIQMHHESNTQILAEIDEGKLDVGVITEANRFASHLQVRYRFQDGFTLIVPPKVKLKERVRRASLKHILREVGDLPWISLSPQTVTGQLMHEWLRSQEVDVDASMQIDSFDMIINLVSLGIGMGIVPKRALALYAKRRLVKRVILKGAFSRNIVVVTRKANRADMLILQFIDAIAF